MDDVQFIVMVDSAAERSHLVSDLASDFPELEQRKAHSGRLRGNWLEVYANDDADPAAAADPDNGFLHFRWRVEVTPLDSSVDENHQIRLARDLLAHFRSAEATAEVLANFEDRL